MALPKDFYEQLPLRSAEELYDMIGHQEGYMPEAIALAKDELAKRNLLDPENVAKLEIENVEEETQGSYAGFWLRFVALFIDAIILYSLVLMIGAIIGLGVNQMVGSPFFSVLPWLYFAFMESSKYQGTLGKKAMRIIVTDIDGYPINFGRATGRFFAKWLSGFLLTFGLDYLAVLTLGNGEFVEMQSSGALLIGMTLSLIALGGLVGLTKEKRALHDMVAGTRVLRCSASVLAHLTSLIGKRIN